MLDRKKMQQFEEHGGSAALKMRGELVTALQDRIGGTLRAVNAYFDSRRKSETAISKRVKELEARQEALEEEVAQWAYAARNPHKAQQDATRDNRLQYPHKHRQREAWEDRLAAHDSAARFMTACEQSEAAYAARNPHKRRRER